MDNKQFPKDSAGRRMIDKVPLCFPEQSILDVKKMLFEKTAEIETLNYIYVTDRQKKLLGVFSIKEIFREPESAKIKEIMKINPIKVRPYTDQERAAILALENNLKAIPVSDKDNKFLGVIPSDVILDILHSENVEDFLRLAGIRSSIQNILKGNVLFSAKVRIPWLILGLLGGILAAQIVEVFEAPLRSHFILAAFIPLILYIASAVGTQTETLFIRSLVLDSGMKVGRYLFKEIQTAFLMALILGGLLSLISFFWFNSPYYIGIIMGTSLFFTILMATFIGVSIPYFLQKIKKDPAIGTGPFATIVRDILSLLIYFAVAIILLKLFL